MPAVVGEGPLRSAGRKTEALVSNETPPATSPAPKTAVRIGPPGSGPARMQDEPHSYRERDRQQAGQDEVCDLDPTESTEAEQAERVTGEVESVSIEHLHCGDTDEQRTCNHTAAQQDSHLGLPESGAGTGVLLEVMSWLICFPDRGCVVDAVRDLGFVSDFRGLRMLFC